MANFIVLGTWNTKYEELEFICKEIKRRSHHPIKLDISTKKTTNTRDVEVSNKISDAKNIIKQTIKNKHISGAISVGGGTNLFMATKIMEEIPLLVPKIIISTMIVNSVYNFRTYKDIVYMQSPCDSGIYNPLIESVLRNGVAILTSMSEGLPSFTKPSIAITGFGISDNYFKTAKDYWSKKGYHLMAFHSAGENTMAMAELIQRKVFTGVLDLTLHDVIDYIGGGAFGKIDERRVASYLSMDIPAVMAPGGMDSIAYISDEFLPSSFKKRKVYYHDFRKTVKANKNEVIKAAKWIGRILKDTNPKNCIFLIPLQGWSSPGEPGKPFYDPELFTIFGKWIKKFFRQDCVIEVDLSINDPQFGRIACEHLYNLIKNQK